MYASKPLGAKLRRDETDWNDQAYITKPTYYPTSPAKLLLHLTGGTGLKSQNNQIQSDKFADEGYIVVMPDLFNGDPAPTAASTTIPEGETSGSSFLASGSPL